MPRILFFSSSRADSGILSPLIEAANKDSRFELIVLATGGHFSESQGVTFEEEFRYLEPEKLVGLSLDDRREDIVHHLPFLLDKFLEFLKISKFDVAIVLGDRVETLLFSLALTTRGIPICHIHGGEITTGSVDEIYRHAITKLGSLHFCKDDESAARVIQMGEDPGKVFSLGSPMEDKISSLKPMPNSDFLAATGLGESNGFFLVCMHPSTFDYPSTLYHLESVLSALDSFPDYQLLFTAPNMDPEGQGLSDLIESYVSKEKGRAKFVRNLGASYLEALRRCDLAIGNSSSFVLEAPRIGARTIFIGRRQEGRALGSRGLPADSSKIKKAIENALQMDKPLPIKKSSVSVSIQILDKIMHNLPNSIEKRFHELDSNR